MLLAEVSAVDLEARKVRFEDGGEVGYDFLVLATGASHSYFGRDAWVRFAPGLKSLEDACEIRRRFLLTFEQAERESDPEMRRALLTYVVVGGGATGVEMAGTLKEIASRTLPREFRHILTEQARVGPACFNGYLAWLAWLFIHLIQLVGFQNRVAVLLNWCGAYITTQRRARLILKPCPRPGKGDES